MPPSNHSELGLDASVLSAIRSSLVKTLKISESNIAISSSRTQEGVWVTLTLRLPKVLWQAISQEIQTTSLLIKVTCTPE